jgi:eukaryotic-like serine/threonine-protein kinase
MSVVPQREGEIMPADEPAPGDGVDSASALSQISASERTDTAPAYPPPLAHVPIKDSSVPALATGQVIEDFEILRLLGAGGFARVYLARQISLSRLVALKVSANRGSEARTLARLEHQHIVQVFAEIILVERNLRLLCIQFVPGITLARLINALAISPSDSRDGRAFVKVLDELCTEATTFDLGGLEVRAFLQTCDHVELACWLGARLAEALAHAHSQGIIHRDIKPANILINRYGRPFLADFNIAHDTESGAGIFGGTLAYMSPEQLDAYARTAGASASNVDARSDLYSLALVMFEFLTGKLPFTRKIDESNAKSSLLEVSRERHAGAPSARVERTDVPELMDRLLRRCLEPAPERRFASAAELIQALDGCRDLLQVEKEPGQQSRLVRVCRARPFLMMVLIGLLAHLAGSVVNILYNNQIVVTKDPAQKASFYQLVLVYNIVVYPILVPTAIFVIWRAWLGWRRLRSQADLATDETTRLRQQALALPSWIVALSCLGWFPGGVVFPVGMHLQAGPLSAGDFVHFIFSFVISGLIATTYAYFAAQFVVLRVLYPQMWTDPAGAREIMQAELRGLPARLWFFQRIAVLIPSLGVCLLMSAGPDQLTLTFRFLVTALIGLGVVGFELATKICNRLTHVLALLTGTARQSGDTSHGLRN